MSSYRKGDRVSLSGLVQNVEGDFIMVALDGALDDTVPAMVSTETVSLLKASIHQGDEVEGGRLVHSTIPNTPLVLLQLINGDPNDPGSFSTALRDSLVLVRAAGAVAPVSAPKPLEAKPAPSPESPPLTTAAPAPAPAVLPEAVAPASQAPAAPVIEKSPENGVDDGKEALASASLSSDMVRRQESSVPERVSDVADDALRAREGRSIADLGTVREEASPLKPSDELVLTEKIEGEGEENKQD